MSLMACSEQENEPVDTIKKQEVHDVMEVWANGMLENDPVKIDQVLAPSWVYSGGGDGSTTTKAEALNGMTPGESSLKKVTLMDTTVWLYENVAIVRGWEELVIVEDQDTSKLYLRFTDVFRKENGEVRAISTHSSPITTMME